MISISFNKAAEICQGTLYNTLRGDVVFKGVSIDSRTINPGQMFVAIKGEKQDGHNYIDQVLSRNALGLLVHTDFSMINQIPGTTPVVTVKDSHVALTELAKWHLADTDPKRIAVTGSNGKTTTKEFIYRMISSSGKAVFRSPGNYNNLFGVPLAILEMDGATEIAVLETGISTKNEMPELSKIVKPDIVLITNVGPSHLEFMNSVHEVAQAKLDLIRFAPDHAKLIINLDDPILLMEAEKLNRDFITFGMNDNADIHPDSVEYNRVNGTVVVIESNEFQLPLAGEHQVYNLLAAYASAKAIGVDFKNINTYDIHFETAPLRGERVVKNGITFIVDCYNANPASVKAGLLSFLNNKTDKRKIIVLGDMLELGRDSSQYHYEVGDFLAKYSFDLALLVGKMSKHIYKAVLDNKVPRNKVIHFEKFDELNDEIKSYLSENDLVYLKASRGIGLERILKQYQKEEVA